MNRDARPMSGILLIAVPAIQYGGYFLMRLFSGWMPRMKPSPLRALLPEKCSYRKFCISAASINSVPRDSANCASLDQSK